MGIKSMSHKKLAEQEIDQIVTAQADDDAAWEKPVRVCRMNLATVERIEAEPNKTCYRSRLSAKNKRTKRLQ